MLPSGSDAPMRLKLMQFNVQDLFLQLAYPISTATLQGLTERQWQLLGAEDVELKPLGKLRGLGRVIFQERPDVVLLNEVGGPESLAHFARLFLDDRYEPLILPGRARRGIGNGFLVRRGLPLRAELRSHRDLPTPFHYPHELNPAAFPAVLAYVPSLGLEPPEARTMSRDVAELRLLGPGGAPVLGMLLVHLKSAYDPDRIDPGGVKRRAAEVRALLDLYDRVAAELAAPLVLAGDMNAIAAREGTAAELRPLYERADLEDALALAGHPPYERITHLTFFLDEVGARQLDYILLPAPLRRRLVPEGTYVHRYRFDEDPRALELPASLRDRAQLPSDHYPVVCTLDLGDEGAAR